MYDTQITARRTKNSFKCKIKKKIQDTTMTTVRLSKIFYVVQLRFCVVQLSNRNETIFLMTSILRLIVAFNR